LSQLNPEASTAVHLYGVLAADAPEHDARGRQDAPVRRISDEDLAVLVSDVDPDARVGASDLLAHAHVLEEYAADVTVIPMRFGIMVTDDDSVREQVLEQQREQNLELLRRFDGLVQVTVQVFHEEEPALREVIARDPALLQLQQDAAGGSQDAKIRLGEAVAARLDALENEDGDVVVERLVPLAEDYAIEAAQGLHEVAHLSLLVRRDQLEALNQAVSQAQEELPQRLRFRYVGPQPPYSFLERATQAT
jgi:hypothetical protein